MEDDAVHNGATWEYKVDALSLPLNKQLDL